MTFTLMFRPNHGHFYRTEKSQVYLVFVSEPFDVETKEGTLHISPETRDDWGDDWGGGYYVAYPDDGEKPYPVSPQSVLDDYVRV